MSKITAEDLGITVNSDGSIDLPMPRNGDVEDSMPEIPQVQYREESYYRFKSETDDVSLDSRVQWCNQYLNSDDYRIQVDTDNPYWTYFYVWFTPDSEAMGDFALAFQLRDSECGFERFEIDQPEHDESQEDNTES